MKRRRHIGCPKPTALTARIYDHVEAILQMERIAHSRALDETHEFGAARQIDVLSVIDDVAVNLERRRASAEQTAAFKKFYVPARVFEFERGGKAGQAAADDRYTGRSQDSNTTCSFSPFDSAARSRSGSCGSCSILLSSRS